MRTNYVLIDYENVQPEGWAALDHDHFKIIVFVGASQSKLSFESVAALQRFGNRAEYVKISGNGSNALDFHIAFYIGQLSMQQPVPWFHIVSKDKGFDPLVQHLRDKKIGATRWNSIVDILLPVSASVKPVANTPPISAERMITIIAQLKKRGATKPVSIKTLSSTISAMFQKSLSETEVSALVSDLVTSSVIKVTGNKVSYLLPA